MAGLGTNVSSFHVLRARMDGWQGFGGAPISVWYFGPGNTGPVTGFMGDRLVPSAHVEVIEGRPTTVSFLNDAQMNHTIHLHGLDVDQANDGVGATSFEVLPGERTKYRFVAPHAGTYHYHCHVDTTLHYARGMFGTVIVRPPGGQTNLAWSGGPQFDEEVLWHLHTISTPWHMLIRTGVETKRYHPDTFLLNGRVTADALVDPFTKISATVGQRVYLRLVNCCYNWARVSLGGLPFEVVASDGRPMRTRVLTGVWELGPGERYDVLFQSDAPVSTLAHVDYLDDYTGAVLGSAETSIDIV